MSLFSSAKAKPTQPSEVSLPAMPVDDRVVVGRGRVVGAGVGVLVTLRRRSWRSRARRSCRRCRTPRPGPVILRSASGKTVLEPSSLPSAAASLHLAKPVDSGPISAYRSARLRQATAVLLTEVRTDMPSIATLSSTYSMPASAQALASSSLILREASRDVGLARAERLEAVARAGARDRVGEPRVQLRRIPRRRLSEIGSTVDDPDTLMAPATPPSAGAPVAGAEVAAEPPQAATTTRRGQGEGADALGWMRASLGSPRTASAAQARRVRRPASSCPGTTIRAAAVNRSCSTALRIRLTLRAIQAVADAAHGDEMGPDAPGRARSWFAASGRGRPPYVTPLG